MTYQWYWPDENPYSWDFDRWRTAYPAPYVRSPQSDSAEPLPLLERGTDRERWEGELAPRWRDVSAQLLGTLNHSAPPCPSGEPVGPRMLTEHYSMQRYRYLLAGDEYGFGWLLTPHRNKVPEAAVLALHPTAVNGKDQIVGLDETATPANGGPYARELAVRGLTVFAPDAISFGERQMAHRNGFYRSAWDFFDAHPDGSVMAKMVFDASRALDLLESLGYRRFGSIGHSHGAYGTLFAMLGDDRILSGVMSCGINLLRDDPGPERWWRATALIPRLGLGDEQAVDTAIDFHHWLALVAPRPVLVTGGAADAIFPNCAPLPGRLEPVREVYGLYGAEADFTVNVHSGGHIFTPAARDCGYKLLRTALA